MPKIKPPKGANAFWRWIDREKVKMEPLARRLRVTPQHLSEVKRGNTMPSLALAQRIARLTKGEVDANSWAP